jgi:hypothetical protein
MQIQFLRLHGTSEKVMVYFLTCACVDFYMLALNRLGPKLMPGVQVSPPICPRSYPY